MKSQSERSVSIVYRTQMECEMFTRHRAIRQRRFPGAWAPMSLSLLWDVERPKPHTIGLVVLEAVIWENAEKILC